LKISVLIVNYRTPELVIGCLKSLASERVRHPNFQVWVGDADSGDQSVKTISHFIAAQGYDWAHCFDIGRNGGFAFGNSAIFEKYVLPDPDVTHVHFLNPDTYVREGAVQALAEFLTAHPMAGAAGSRLENSDGTQRSCVFLFPTPWREFFRGASLGLFDRLVPRSNCLLNSGTEPMRADWVSGASFMVPRAVLEQVGQMDAGYFLYFEETDLMARMKGDRFEVWHVPQSKVVHWAGQATGYRAGNKPQRLSPHWLRSRARYFRRHHGRGGLIMATIFFLVGDLFYRLRCVMLMRRPMRSPALWRDYLRYGLKAEAEGDTRV